MLAWIKSHWKSIAMTTAAGALLAGITISPAASPAPAPGQISVGVNLGPAPACPYGYFDYAPYNCAPYGYYGPDWFTGGIFLGAGPWFHGPGGFYGHVDNRYNPNNGYHGPLPERGAAPFNHFQGNVAINGHGQPGNAGHPPSGERMGGFSGMGGRGGGGRPPH